jgi:methylmalonyl-CoA epimerase
MKAILDHVGIAVRDVETALAFYRDALGLDVAGVEEVGSQRVRAHFVPVGGAALELLEGTAADSAITKYIEKRGPGLHHITLRVDDISAALSQLKARGVRLIDEQSRPGAEGALVAFIHPSSAHGVLVELKQEGAAARHVPLAPPPTPGHPQFVPPDSRTQRISRYLLGELELISLYDGYFGLDGGSMFGVVPRPLWSAVVAADDRNRIPLAMRPLLVRGVRTMLIDAGVGDKENAKFADIYALDRARHLDHALAEAGVAPKDIDIVLATHLHFDHAGGFTVRDAAGTVQPRFPRARYVVRRGEWEDATHPHARNRASYLADNFVPLAEAGVLSLVDDDQTIMPGVRVERAAGHTAHHQLIRIESAGQHAVYAGDLVPTTAHLPEAWIMGFDLFPVDSLASKQAFLRDARARDPLVFFPHDPAVAAGRLREVQGKFHVHAE